MQISPNDDVLTIADKTAGWMRERLPHNRETLAETLTRLGRATGTRTVDSWYQQPELKGRWYVTGRFSPLAMWFLFLRAISSISESAADELLAISRDYLDRLTGRRRDVAGELRNAIATTRRLLERLDYELDFDGRGDWSALDESSSETQGAQSRTERH